MPEADEAALAAYADGRLGPADRAALEARLEREPALAAALERQRVGLTAITTAAESVSAPLALRSRIEAMQRDGAAPRRRRRARGWGWLPSAGARGRGARRRRDRDRLQRRPGHRRGARRRDPPGRRRRPARPRPAAAPAATRSTTCASPTSRASSAGRPWAPGPTRSAGRETKTVFYRKEGRRIAYTIVEGEQLAWPPGADKTEREGTKLRTFTDGDRTVVTWRRKGRTCVLSATNVPVDQLLELAAWKGQGAVDF